MVKILEATMLIISTSWQYVCSIKRINGIFDL